jgi:hypothetical protein
MPRTHYTGQSVGLRTDERIELPSNNHFTEKTAGNLSKTAALKGLTRVAGNVYINNSTKDMWSVRGGKLMRLTGMEVDNGETLKITISANPQEDLENIMDDLTF